MVLQEQPRHLFMKTLSTLMFPDLQSLRQQNHPLPVDLQAVGLLFMSMTLTLHFQSENLETMRWRLNFNFSSLSSHFLGQDCICLQSSFYPLFKSFHDSENTVCPV